MTSSVRPKLYNYADKNNEETDFITCPLLELINSKSRKPITKRLGQKARYLKLINDNQPLFKNKTEKTDLENTFKICKPKKLANQRNLLHNTPIVCAALKNQNNSSFETPSNTFADSKRKTIRKLNFKPILPLSTKKLLNNSEENLPEQEKKELKTTKSKILTQNYTDSSSCLPTTKEITKKLPINVLPETYRNNHGPSLNFNFSKTTSVPESSDLSSSNQISNALVDSSLLVEQLKCQSLDNEILHFSLELTPAAQPKNLVVHPQFDFIPSKEHFKQPINDINSICICESNNFISVKGINYNILNTLGQGGSSIVYKALHPKTNTVVAIKKVDLSGVEDIIAKGYLNEVTLLQNLQDCKSVIRLFDSQYIIEEKNLYMIMEKGDTDLSNLIRSTKNMSVHMIMYYWSEMLTIVNEIHARGIIHSDLKPANFLLVNGRLKLIDFGIASKIQGDMTSVLKDITTGTWNYMSPECIRNGDSNFSGHKINQKSDVWSLGCILYNLIYGKTPFSHLTNTWQKLQAIGDLKQNICFPSNSMTFKHGIPYVLMQTMKLCLLKDIKSRPSVLDLLSLMENTVFKSIVI